MSKVKEFILDDQFELTLSMITLPKDSNPYGDVFGGWTLANLDLAGAALVRRKSKVTATKAVNHVEFIKPIKVGDHVKFYAKIIRQGNTSFVVDLMVYSERFFESENKTNIIHTANAEFVYVHI